MKSSHIIDGMYVRVATSESTGKWFLKRLNIDFLDPAIPPLDIYAREMKTHDPP